MKPVAVVTGGRRGIGLTIAKDLMEDYTVVVVAKSKTFAGYYYQADLETEAEHVIPNVLKDFGRIDVLINNAGVQKLQPAINTSVQDWQTIINTNLTAPFILARDAGAWMKEHGGGKIINITSIAALRPARNIAPYIASKAGLDMLTKALACEWAQYGINVNSIAPGFIETDMSRVNNTLRPEMIERIPAQRFGVPDDLISAVRFLLAADYVHGITLTVDGGWCAKN
jgi:2-deoxy-D-gluconate 3-dehydrogenase